MKFFIILTYVVFLTKCNRVGTRKESRGSELRHGGSLLQGSKELVSSFMALYANLIKIAPRTSALLHHLTTLIISSWISWRSMVVCRYYGQCCITSIGSTSCSYSCWFTFEQLWEIYYQKWLWQVWKTVIVGAPNLL